MDKKICIYLLAAIAFINCEPLTPVEPQTITQYEYVHDTLYVDVHDTSYIIINTYPIEDKNTLFKHWTGLYFGEGVGVLIQEPSDLDKQLYGNLAMPRFSCNFYDGSVNQSLTGNIESMSETSLQIRYSGSSFFMKSGTSIWSIQASGDSLYVTESGNKIFSRVQGIFFW